MYEFYLEIKESFCEKSFCLMFMAPFKSFCPTAKADLFSVLVLVLEPELLHPVTIIPTIEINNKVIFIILMDFINNDFSFLLIWLFGNAPFLFMVSGLHIDLLIKLILNKYIKDSYKM